MVWIFKNNSSSINENRLHKKCVKENYWKYNKNEYSKKKKKLK